MTVHLEAQPGDIAPVVLLPGDPLRAQFVAEQFLTGATCHNRVRNALGYTGRFRDHRVSVQSTGMGMPSCAIYAHELLADYGARVLIRIGTCGALQPDLELGDVVLAMSASTDSAMIRHRFGGMDYAPTASFELLRRAADLGATLPRPPRVGPVLTSDTFYAARDDWWKAWAEHGVLAAEMETAALYTLAAKAGARALSILTVSDHVLTGAHTTPAERQRGFARMVELALELAAQVA
ncbi:MAG: purine-nucleoside phosphorylase [Myxococcales bacterium]|nr:purine-nucleoside phosphorylase [Myxococcales bacterium]